VGVVGFFGYTGIPGHGKTPKVYYLKRKGFDVLCAETSLLDDAIGEFTDVHKEATWTPQMYHRIRIIDLLISLEVALRSRPHLKMVKPFLSYRMVKSGNRVSRETTDFVTNDTVSENKLVPDAAFILENIELNKRRLYFLEMDMGTEQIVSYVSRDSRITLKHRFSQYDRYLQGKRFAQTYGAYGEFGFFILLFVTHSRERLENIRRELADLPAELTPFYRLTTFDEAMHDFFSPVWKSRAPTDTSLYPLVQEGAKT
jgi:hypothetical protein